MELVRCEVTEGPRDGFKSVGLQSAEGHFEYLVVEDRFLAFRDDHYYLPVVVVGRDARHETVLVQLPFEADSGANRVWVRQEQVVTEAVEVPA